MADDEEKGEEGAPAWMATFADMSTLLLCFFVLLLSFANTDAQKFRDMLGSVQDAFGVQKETPGDYMARSSEVIEFALEQMDEEGKKNDSESDSQSKPSMEQILSIVQALFDDMGGVADIFMDEEGVTVRVEGKLLYSSGSADLKPEAIPILDRIAALLKKYNFDLYILGHTDSVPIETAKFPSNWELSSARSAAALKHMMNRGASSERLVAIGFADSRPIETNASPEGRAKNRRVEFMFKSPDSLPDGKFKPATY